MNSMMHWTPSGLTLSSGTTIVIDGAPANMAVTAQSPSGAIVSATATPVGALMRYVLDVSGFSAPGDVTPVVTLVARQGGIANAYWSTQVTPANGAGFSVPWSMFVEHRAWTGDEKTLAWVAGLALAGGLAYAFWPKGKVANPRRRR